MPDRLGGRTFSVEGTAPCGDTQRPATQTGCWQAARVHAAIPRAACIGVALDQSESSLLSLAKGRPAALTGAHLGKRSLPSPTRRVGYAFVGTSIQRWSADIPEGGSRRSTK